ncbi:hypothetical protein FZ983_32345 [Azospirillum sp. B21]|uniref:SPRY domain-containing protein n=1 Tax=Azospirillum sp. B21 TaxID=2607496 RepID=UPI0011ECEC59|nr:SPRY domain-containing protein [Azospirillum sp. B21]KAA0572263.1 hypothetical protein FZ983_32345 [Azospirillum sp. B21]
MTYPIASPMRAGLMSPAHAQFVEAGSLFCGTASGTANALTVSTGKSLTGLMVNQIVGLKTGASANSGAATMNVDGLGAKAIQKNGSALSAGDLPASTNVWAQYDGTAFQLLGGAGGGVSFQTLTKTGAYTVTAADAGKLIDCNGTFTITFPTASTVSSGFTVVVHNSGSGTVSVSADGVTPQLTPGTWAFLIGDGTTYRALASDARSKATLSPTDKSGGTLSNANLTLQGGQARATSQIFGKRYWEVYINAISGACQLGVSNMSHAISTTPGTDTSSWAFTEGGSKYYSGAPTSLGSAQSAGQVLMFAVDVSAGAIWFGANGTWYGSGNPASGANPAFTGLSGSLYPTLAPANATYTARFSYDQWSYSAPTGFGQIT